MTASKKKKGLSLALKTIIAAVVVLGAVGAGFIFWLMLLGNVQAGGSKNFVELKIPRNSTFEQVLDSLRAKDALRSEASFRTVAGLLKYPGSVKYGYYRLPTGMGNLALVRMLRAGAQSTVKLRFDTERTVAQMAATLSQQLEYPADSFRVLLEDQAFLSRLKGPEGGYLPQTALSMFLPNTYEVYWTVKPKALLQKLAGEHRKYWNDARTAKAKAKGLTPIQVAIVASIVQEENQAHPTEWPRIAGVYLNRLDRGMRLQADPTVKFALGNFALRRILTRDLAFESPYNTYLHTGLPPGPINNPDTRALDAVLNAEAHDYLYMVAKADFSGYHSFAETLAQHERYAEEYRRALNEQGIRR